MKILTVCEGGACRSVALARVLKDKAVNGGATNDAIPVSWRWNSKDTLYMLCAWADLIVVMQPEMARKIPGIFDAKLKVCDVGPDRWGSAVDPELTSMCLTWARANGLISIPDPVKQEISP